MKQPFILTIQTTSSEGRASICEQRLLALPYGKAISPRELASIGGLPFASVQDDILRELRANHHKPAVLLQGKPIELDEVSGVRLTLLFKTIATLSSRDAIQTMQWKIAAMSPEETYYWFAKCYGENEERAVHSFRILHGAEPIPLQLEEASEA